MAIIFLYFSLNSCFSRSTDFYRAGQYFKFLSLQKSYKKIDIFNVSLKSRWESFLILRFSQSY